jgi:5-methylcytosine-specific restriction protein A
MTIQTPFIPELLYKRSAIHDEYGGNRQGGISPSAKAPFIFIFSGKSGAQYGYQDGWDNQNVYSYTGEGQIGDMQFIRGNLALKDHLNNGKRIFFFEIEGKGYVKFICELEFHDADICDTPDLNGDIRKGIKFFLKRKGAVIPPIYSNTFDEDHKVEDTFLDYETVKPNQTERSGLVTSRVGQGAYRKRIIHRWEYKCAVTNFNKLEILIASHIVPWAEASDTERLDVHNGILLSPTYDALFDKHLLTFDEKGKIVLTDEIEFSAFEKIGITGKEQIKGLNDYNLEYLNRHNKKCLFL